MQKRNAPQNEKRKQLERKEKEEEGEIEKRERERLKRARRNNWGSQRPLLLLRRVVKFTWRA